MKVSLQLLTEAVDFAVGNGKVLEVLGPVDRLQTSTANTLRVEYRVYTPNHFGVKILFDYKKRGNGAITDIIVKLNWFKDEGKFTVESVEKFESQN